MIENQKRLKKQGMNLAFPALFIFLYEIILQALHITSTRLHPLLSILLLGCQNRIEDRNHNCAD